MTKFLTIDSISKYMPPEARAIKLPPSSVLAADHRNGFKKVLGVEGREFFPHEVALAKHIKSAIIAEGFRRAVRTEGAFKQGTQGLLMDQMYGSEPIAQLLADPSYVYNVGVPVEESKGRSGFHLEHEGNAEDGTPKFQTEITKYEETGHPVAFIKALITYNPDQPQADRERLYEQLRPVIEFAHSKGYPFVLEPLIKPLKSDLTTEQVKEFDEQERPGLAVKMIEDFRNAGLLVDMWKIEAFEKPEHFQAVLVEAAKAENGDDVKIVVLGRDASPEVLENWLRVAAQSRINVDGIDREVYGAYVGRSNFKGPIEQYENETRQDVIRRNKRGLLRHPYESFRRGLVNINWRGIEKNAASKAADTVAANYIHYDNVFYNALRDFDDQVKRGERIVPTATLKQPEETIALEPTALGAAESGIEPAPGFQAVI